MRESNSNQLNTVGEHDLERETRDRNIEYTH